MTNTNMLIRPIYSVIPPSHRGGGVVVFLSLVMDQKMGLGCCGLRY